MENQIPKEFQKLLDQDNSLKLIWKKVPPSHKKEFIKWILDAKKEETRQARIIKTIKMLKDDKRWN